MNESWSNNIRMLNGAVKPPIVLRSETELFIAQNAHNLVWEKHRSEYDKLDKEIKTLEKSGADSSEVKERRKVLSVTARQEIDALIITEITSYRAERSGKTSSDIEDRLELVEKELKKLRSEIDEINLLAEDAQSTAEDAQLASEEALILVKSIKKDEVK